MKIYIATKFENQAKFHELKDLLEEFGHTVPRDWTNERERGDMTEVQWQSYLKTQAQADADGVADCDALVLITVKESMAGAFVEMGIAAALSKRILLVDEGNKNNIFFRLPCVEQMGDFEDVINALEPRR